MHNICVSHAKCLHHFRQFNAFSHLFNCNNKLPLVLMCFSYRVMLSYFLSQKVLMGYLNVTQSTWLAWSVHWAVCRWIMKETFPNIVVILTGLLITDNSIKLGMDSSFSNSDISWEKKRNQKYRNIKWFDSLVAQMCISKTRYQLQDEPIFIKYDYAVYFSTKSNKNRPEIKPKVWLSQNKYLIIIRYIYSFIYLFINFLAY